MKKYFVIFYVSIYSILSYGQPLNNDCESAIVLNIGLPNGCSSTLGDNINATASGELPLPICGDFGVGYDAWYLFYSKGEADTKIQISSIVGQPGDWAMEAYTGDCGDLQFFDCSDDENGLLPKILFQEQELGTKFYIRVWQKSNSEQGQFNICGARLNPINEICNNALQIGCGKKYKYQSPEYAATSSNPFSCSYGDGLWYKFEPTISGSLSINVDPSSNFDVEISVGTSADCINFSSLFCEDSNGSGSSETVTLNYVSGESYYIYVAAIITGSPYYGLFDISLESTPPINNTCSSAQDLSLGEIASCTHIFLGDNTCAQNSFEQTSSQCFQSSREGQDIWFKTVVPPSGKIVIETSSAGELDDLGIQVYDGYCGYINKLACTLGNLPSLILEDLEPEDDIYIQIWNLMPNDAGSFNICAYEKPEGNTVCTTATEMYCGQTITNQNTQASLNNGNVLGCDVGKGLWYKFQPELQSNITISITPDINFDPEISIATSIDCSSFTNIACVNDQGVGGIEQTSLVVSMGQTYYIFVGDQDGSNFSIGQFGISIEGTAALNNDCSNAIELFTQPEPFCVPETGSVECATPSGELPIPTCGNFGLGQDIWYRAVVPISGLLTIEMNSNTGPSNFGLEAYSGTCGNFISLGCDENSSSLGYPQLEIESIPGSTVYFRIWELFVGDFTDFTICVYETPVDNATCDLAEEMLCGESILGVTTQGSFSNGSFGCVQGLGVWYKYDTPGMGSFTLTVTPEAGYDVALAVSTTSDCTNYTNIVCKDDNLMGVVETVDISFSTPTTYYIFVGNSTANTAGGIFDISLTSLPSSTDECVGAITIPLTPPMSFCNFISIPYSCSTASSDLPLPSCGNFNNNRDVWMSFTVPTNGNIKFFLNAVTGNPEWHMQLYSGSCGSLVLEDCFANAGVDWELENLTPGDVLYLRMWDQLGNEDVEMEICALELEVPAENDNCNSATPIGCFQTLANESNYNSTDNGDAAGCASGVGVWYLFEPQFNGSGTIHIDPALLSISISIATSVDCISFTNIACESSLVFGEPVEVSFSFLSTNSYYIYVGDSSFSGTLFGDFSISLECDDDDCLTALPLDVGNISCQNLTVNNVDSSPSNIVPLPTCPGFGGGNDNWYSVAVPISGDITVEMSDALGPDNWVMEAYSGTCGALILIDCNDDSNGTLFPKLEFVDRTPGEVIYLRVWEFDNDEFGDVNICAYEPPLHNTACNSATSILCGQLFANQLIEPAFDSGDDTGCDMGAGVWYKYVTTYTGEAFLSVTPSNGFDVTMSVSTTNDCIAFTNIECLNNIGAGGIESTTLNFTNGQEFYIYIAHVSGNSGSATFNLEIESDQETFNDDCEGAYFLSVSNSSTECFLTYGENNCSTVSNFSPSPLCGDFGVGQDIWYTLSVPSTGNVRITIDNLGSSQNWQMQAFSGSCDNASLIDCEATTSNGQTSMLLYGRSPSEFINIRVWNEGSAEEGTFGICATPIIIPSNDTCSNATVLNCGATLLEQSLLFSTNQSNDPTCDLGTGTWYKFEPTNSGTATVEVIGSNFNPGLYVSSSTDCVNFNNIDCINVNSSIATKVFSYVANTTYYFNVTNTVSQGDFSISLIGTPPTNDDCIDAILLSVNLEGVCNNFSTNNYCSTSGPEVDVCGNNDGVWFSVVLPQRGSANIEVSSSSVVGDWRISAFRGNCQNLNISSCRTNSAFISGYSGEELFFNVQNMLGNQGEFDICVYQPAIENDICANAIPLACLTLSDQKTIGSTENGDMTGCDFGDGVWYIFEPVYSGSATLFVDSQTGYDPAVSISRSSNCINFNNIECSDTNGDERIDFSYVGGFSYYIYVGDNCCNTEGYFNISLLIDLPENNACTQAIDLPVGSVNDCVATIGNTSCASQSTVLSDERCFDGFNKIDVWYKLTTPDFGLVELEINHSGILIVEVFTGTCGNLELVTCGFEFSNVYRATLEDIGPAEDVYIIVSTTLYYGQEFSICAYEIVPENDICDDATSINCGEVRMNQTTGNSTENGDDTQCDSGIGTWYKFSPQMDGQAIVKVDPQGSFDAEVSISSSSDCINFTGIGCVDVAGVGGTEVYTFTYTSGLNYFIYVGDRLEDGTMEGNFDISLVCQNDDCFDAQKINVGSLDICTPVYYNNENATASGELPTPSCGAFGNGIDNWHFVDVPEYGNVTLELSDAGLGLDWAMEVYTGSCGALTSVDCANSLTNGTALVELKNYTFGQRLYIRVWKDWDNPVQETGTYSICAYLPKATNIDCNSAISILCGDTLLNQNNLGAPRLSGSCFPGDAVFYKYEALEAGSIEISIDFPNLNSKAVLIQKGSNCNNLEEISCDFFTPSSYSKSLDVELGEVYYINVGSFSPLIFDISLQCTCNMPKVDAFINYTTCPDEIVVDVNIGDLGEATGINLSNNSNDDIFTNVGIGEYAFTGLELFDQLVFYYEASNNLSCADSILIDMPNICAPINDNYFNAKELVCGQSILSESARFAHPDIGLLNSACYLDRRGIWYSFVATDTGTGMVTVAKEDFDGSNIEIFKDENGELLRVSCTVSSLTSTSLTFDYLEGENYLFRVVDFISYEIFFNIDLQCTLASPPLNNDCVTAAEIVANGQEYYFDLNYSLFGATSSGEPSSCNSYDDVWFKFTALSEIQEIRATTNAIQNSSELSLTVYNGDCTNLTEGGCIVGDYILSEIYSGFVQGETYYIKIANTQSGPTMNLGELQIRSLDCEDYLNLKGINKGDLIGSNDQPYNEARIDIVSDQVLKSGADIIYNAANSVLLEPNFEIKPLATFETIIGPCQFDALATPLNFD